MTNETEQIFSSTGSLGVSRRQNNRLYINPETFSADAGSVRTLGRLKGIVERGSHQVTRGVFRGAVAPDVFREITRNGYSEGLEVALPLAEFTGDNDGSWLIYWAHNGAERTPIVPVAAMREETSIYRESGFSPVDRINHINGQGFTFRNQFTLEQVDQIHGLWGPTFGWERQEVEALGQRLVSVAEKNAADRDVWFSAIEDDGQIVSLAMAERLTIPGAQGSINLVESTEWRTRDEYAGQGLMTATISLLNAAILRDLRESGTPLIYAECNFQSRSDRAGHGAGFTIPERTFASQILVQNVQVGDGQPVPPEKLRDFTFMYVPRQTIQRDYDPLQVAAMVSKITDRS